MAQPTDLATQINSAQWTNGQRLITGSFVMGLFTLILGILSGMGTWTNGVYAPNLPASAIVSNLGFTPANKAGDTFSGNLLAAQSLGLPTTSSPDLTYAGPPNQSGASLLGVPLNPSVVRMAAGNGVSFCPNLSCVYGSGDNGYVPNSSFFDHDRATLLLSAVARDDNHSEEQTLGITTTIATGYHKAWAANTSFNVGDNVIVGNATYRACASASSCAAGVTSASAGTSGASNPLPGTRPTAAQGGSYQITDGSIIWQWVSDGSIGVKLGEYVETSVYPGAGFAEGMTENFSLFSGYDPAQGATGHEQDCTNNSGKDGAVGVNALCHWIAYSGSNKWLTGLLITGNNYAARAVYGLRMAGGAGSNCVFCIDDNNAPNGSPSLGATYGIQVGSLFGEPISHGSADIYLNTQATPNGFLDQSAHTFAAISLAGSAPNGISIGAGYSTTQITGTGWNVTSAGQIQSNGASPYAFLNVGSHTTASFIDNSTSPIALQILGTHATAQIQAVGFNVGSAGALTLGAGITAASLPTAGGTVKGSVCIDTTGVVYVKTTTGPCL